MEQSLKESEPFLPCGWNVFVRAAVQMETLPKPLVSAGGGVGGGKGSIHTYSEFEFILSAFTSPSRLHCQICVLLPVSDRFTHEIHTKVKRKSEMEADENILKKLNGGEGGAGGGVTSPLHPSIVPGKKNKN